MLCTSEIVVKNVRTGLHETRGDHLEDNFSNQSLRYAGYKQFIRWVFKHLAKGVGGSFFRVHYGRLGNIFQSLMQIMVIILKVIKTKSTNINRVKYIVYIIANTMKQTKMKMFFV